MIKLSHVYNTINKVMGKLETIDFINRDKHTIKQNQGKINEAYKILDNFRDELIRENIKNKQRRENGKHSNNETNWLR